MEGAVRKSKLGLIALLSLLSWPVAAEDAQQPPATVPVHLSVASGVPLRLYITQRLWMRTGDPVEAKLIEPVYAFDRVVVPAGVELQGHVTRLDPAPKMDRARAILGGDFTPLHAARAEFTTILMPDGRQVAIHALDSPGLPQIFVPPRPPKKSKKSSKNKPPSDPKAPGTMDAVRQAARQQAEAQTIGRINAKSRGVVDLVRGPNKRERLEEFLIMKLPYHPQWYRRGTRFDAILRDPLDFGTVTLAADALRNVGRQPSPDSSAQVRLLSTVTSATAQSGDKIEGVLSQPLSSAADGLILPEGTRLTGTVTQARSARWLHRSGRLRFAFDRVEPPPFSPLSLGPPRRTEAQLVSVESDPRAGVKVDEEGTAKATESKARLLAPAIAAIIAMKSLDNDAGRNHQVSGTGEPNYGGRVAGGFSGFGMLGAAAGRASRIVGSALGVYGLAWSVYSTVVSRGQEVEFRKNTAMAVRFGSRTPPPAQAKASNRTPLMSGTQ